MEENTEVQGEQQQDIQQDDNKTTEETPKTYTAEELRAETEKSVAEALKNATEKSQVDFEKKLKEARADWEKESKMTAAEKEKAAQEKAQKQFEQEKAEFEHEKLINHAQKQLIKNELPEEIAELITASDADAEAIDNGIAAIKAAFDKAVAASVDNKLKGKPPKTAPPQNTSMADIIARSVKQGF